MILASFQIRDLTIRPAAVLAPMAGVRTGQSTGATLD
jgi:hypothetical protein